MTKTPEKNKLHLLSVVYATYKPSLIVIIINYTHNKQNALSFAVRKRHGLFKWMINIIIIVSFKIQSDLQQNVYK